MAATANRAYGLHSPIWAKLMAERSIGDGDGDGDDENGKIVGGVCRGLGGGVNRYAWDGGNGHGEDGGEDEDLPLPPPLRRRRSDGSAQVVATAGLRHGGGISWEQVIYIHACIKREREREMRHRCRDGVCMCV